ncbi:MAG: beta-galactosidase [Burkholderiales bacterium]|nr:beta-galactosidase [Phycisphaerae bacterium]
MKIGTYYYPEQWPREQWKRDFDKIAAMGLRIVHMAEFAWFDMEPSPGDIRLDWLSECVELAAERGIDVILCTPTAAPPVWLSDQYPEVLGRDVNGAVDRHGGRRHYTPTSMRMQEASLRIVTAMAERFGDHPAVVGWQIDNELGHAFDQSDQTHKGFQAWLQKKYSTIENLNQAWANQFWNQQYQSFEQIRMPASRDPAYRNPHENLDASRYWSYAWAQFVKLQADVLKPKIGNRWITTNFMNLHLDCDPGDMRDSLSLWSWDTYPITGWGSNHTDENFRLGDPASIGLMHDLMNSYNGRWALMEVQPGQVNWTGVPCLPYPGAIRLLLWSAIAHNCEFITVYRFRQPRFGIEMWHDGLVNLDGVTPSPGGLQFKQVAQESKLFADAVSTSATTAQPKAGLIVDFNQLWWTATLPQAKRWNQSELICQWHQALSRMGLKVEILHPDQPWPDGLEIVVAPGMQLVDQPLIDKLDAYVKAGGNLVFTPRTALQDKTGQFFEAHKASLIRDLIGGDVEAYDALPEQTFGTVEFDGKTFKWSIWAELMFADEGTKPWGRFTNMFYAGATAITHKKHTAGDGGGTVTYCGVFGDRDLPEAIIEKLCKQIGLKLTHLPDRVRLLERDGHMICMNFSDKPVTVPAPRNTKFLIGSSKLDPAGVAVWKV